MCNYYRRRRWQRSRTSPCRKRCRRTDQWWRRKFQPRRPGTSYSRGRRRRAQLSSRYKRCWRSRPRKHRKGSPSKERRRVRRSFRQRNQHRRSGPRWQRSYQRGSYRKSSVSSQIGTYPERRVCTSFELPDLGALRQRSQGRSLRPGHCTFPSRTGCSSTKRQFRCTFQRRSRYTHCSPQR